MPSDSSERAPRNAAVDRVEHRLDALGTDASRLYAHRQPVHLTLGYRKSDFFDESERIRGFGTLDDRLRTQVRAVRAGGQQVAG